MSRPALEVADIFRDHGAAWRRANAGHVSLGQLKVMSAIERCRTAALGGHVARCENDKCAHTVIAYNSCRNRHCPKCQGAAAKQWFAEREADLLPVGYFHVVFTLPAVIADIAYQNKAVIYDLLFKASAETMIAIAADPRHLGARIGITAVLHTWGSAMTHHPHVHMIVPGGGITADGSRWVSCRPNFFLSVRVLARLFRGLFLAQLRSAHQAGRLKFFGRHAHLDEARAFKAYLAPLRNIEWVVYAKRPFGGPQAVIAYLSRYTHRIAISNHRLISADETAVTFKWKDYRIEGPDRYKTMSLDTPEFIRRFLIHVLPKGFHRIRHYGHRIAISNHRLISADETAVTFKWKDYRIEGPDRYKTMSLDTPEFIRRFLIHVLPKGFHRIRHYGLLASANRAANIAHARKLLAVPSRPKQPETPKAAIDQPRLLPRPCPCCGGRLIVIETFARGCQPKHWPASPKPIRIDTS